MSDTDNLEEIPATQAENTPIDGNTQHWREYAEILLPENPKSEIDRLKIRLEMAEKRLKLAEEVLDKRLNERITVNVGEKYDSVWREGRLLLYKPKKQ